MAHQQPSNWEEFQRVFHANTKIEGFGLEVTMHSPCPWCAAPDFMVFRVIACEDAFVRGATCRECGRTLMGVPIPGVGNRGYEFVQTGGPDSPEWLQAKPRRVEPSG